MFSPFSCGNFSHVDDRDEEPITPSPSSTPRKSRSRRSTGLLHRTHSRDYKNPYANVGLEKFSAVMAELVEKRQQIYAQTGSQDETLVHFVYNKPDDSVPVPIVVILKDKNKKDKTKSSGSSSPDHDERLVVTNGSSEASPTSAEANKPGLVTRSDKLTKKKVQSDYVKCSDRWTRPSFYLPVIVIFILILLTVFGRTFAILCTSIVWYAVPTLKEYQSSVTGTRSRKQRRVNKTLSDKRMMAS